ncbi:hypothetical protein IFM46972_01736 [Aspergillus udagawae]|uniref:Uncharacterized protein n=1 Tax=Aspergillus udagawae TaxID=91492 RepID=A0A8H3RIR2_9EURO|nr:hypothetical protein IFM46972_01736 [Aspergillus udagawae]
MVILAAHTHQMMIQARVKLVRAAHYKRDEEEVRRSFNWAMICVQPFRAHQLSMVEQSIVVMVKKPYLQSTKLYILVNIIEVLGDDDVDDFLVPEEVAETRRPRTIPWLRGIEMD